MSDGDRPVTTQHQCIRVLIVDDDPVICELLERYLSRRTDLKIVGIAATGIEGVQLCGSLQPDVVVMDYMMPDMDGLTATRAIRRQYPQVKVLILSAAYDRQLAYEGVEAGAFTYLSKAAAFGDLADTIRAANSARLQPGLKMA